MNFDPDRISTQKKELDLLAKRGKRLFHKTFVYRTNIIREIGIGLMLGMMAFSTKVALLYLGLLLVPHGLYLRATKGKRYLIRHQDCEEKINTLVNEIYDHSGLLYCECSYPSHLYSPALQRVWGENKFVFYDDHNNENEAFTAFNKRLQSDAQART